MSNIKNGDYISNLPTDESTATNTEIQLINRLFKDKTLSNVIFQELKDGLIFIILFILVSLPESEKLISSFIPITKNSFYFMLLTKCIILIVFFWLIKHFYLSRK